MATVKEVKLMKDGAMVTPVVLADSVKNLDGTKYKDTIDSYFNAIFDVLGGDPMISFSKNTHVNAVTISIMTRDIPNITLNRSYSISESVSLGGAERDGYGGISLEIESPPNFEKYADYSIRVYSSDGSIDVTVSNKDFPKYEEKTVYRVSGSVETYTLTVEVNGFF